MKIHEIGFWMRKPLPETWKKSNTLLGPLASTYPVTLASGWLSVGKTCCCQFFNLKRKKKSENSVRRSSFIQPITSEYLCEPVFLWSTRMQHGTRETRAWSHAACIGREMERKKQQMKKRREKHMTESTFNSQTTQQRNKTWKNIH